MANETIHDQAAVASADAADELALWVTASSLTKKITKANLLGGSLTGGGVLATGGFTLTVPATGTAALLGTAQTFTAAQTFSAGIIFGHETLNYYDEGTWTPEFSFDGVSTGITYVTRPGYYKRIGNTCHVWGTVYLSNKGSATGAPLIGGLPFTSLDVNELSTIIQPRSIAITFTGQLYLVVVKNTTFISFVVNNNGSESTLTNAAFANDSYVSFSFSYPVG